MTRPKPIFISYALAGGANFARKTWLRVDARFGSTDCAIRAAVFGSRKSRMRGRVCTRHQIWALNTNCGEGRAQAEILAEIPSYHDWWEILAGKLSESGRQSRKSNEGGGMSKLGLWRTVCLVCVFCAMGTIASSTQTFTTLVSFNKTNGANPGGLVQASDGNFYGTTPEGGANTTSCYGNGCGTVFKITPGGTLTTLYSFCSKSGCTDGANPGGLIQATNGNFYGTTAGGGAHGAGTVFEITAGGKLTTLHSFNFNFIDGADPDALVQASDGNFYGTTVYGGPHNYGTVFEITAGGNLTTLHSFDFSDGFGPGGLVQATTGNFYGTTSGGGASGACGSNGCGTVFEITAGGNLTTLHSFDFSDGG
jgi:uncharacterized repeat protein (TIGR03803 family)